MANNNANDKSVNKSVVELKVMFKSFRVYQVEDTIKYRIGLDKTIPVIGIENGDYIETERDYVDFSPVVLIAQLVQQVPSIGIYYNHCKEQGLRNGNSGGFGIAQLQVILQDSQVLIKRTRFVAGEEYETREGEKAVHEHDGYNTEISSVKLSSSGEVRMGKVIDKVLGL